MKLRLYHHISILIVIFASASGAAWLVTNHKTAIAACAQGASVAITSPLPGIVTAGTLQLQSKVAAATQPTALTYYISAPTSAVIGNATPTPSSAGVVWQSNWNTSGFANGPYQIIAVAHFDTTSAGDCPSPPLAFTINNQASTQGSLSISITPSTASVPAGHQIGFQASGIYTTPAGNQTVLNAISGTGYAWVASGGTLSTTTGPTTVYTAGSQTGNFSISLTVTVAGLVQHASASIQIIASSTTAAGSTNTTSPTGTTTTPISISPQQVAQLTGTASIFRPAASTNSAPVVPIDVLACMQTKLGSSYAQIASGQVQPSADERLTAVSCFSGTNRIPAVLAPIAPAQISAIPQDSSVIKLNKITNTTVINSDGKKVSAIVLSGTAAASSDVLLYFFSDPMVLKAQSDSQGKWSYTLEDPLVPGKHEVYAVAPKDANSFVRTPAFPLAVAAAAGNQDGNLIVGSSLRPNQITFAIGGLLAMLAVIFLIFRLRPRTPKPSSDQMKPPTPTVAPTVPLGQTSTPPIAVDQSSPTQPPDVQKP